MSKIQKETPWTKSQEYAATSIATVAFVQFSQVSQNAKLVLSRAPESSNKMRVN